MFVCLFLTWLITCFNLIPLFLVFFFSLMPHPSFCALSLSFRYSPLRYLIDGTFIRSNASLEYFFTFFSRFLHHLPFASHSSLLDGENCTVPWSYIQLWKVWWVRDEVTQVWSRAVCCFIWSSVLLHTLKNKKIYS